MVESSDAVGRYARLIMAYTRFSSGGLHTLSVSDEFPFLKLSRFLFKPVIYLFPLHRSLVYFSSSGLLDVLFTAVDHSIYRSVRFCRGRVCRDSVTSEFGTRLPTQWGQLLVAHSWGHGKFTQYSTTLRALLLLACGLWSYPRWFPSCVISHWISSAHLQLTPVQFRHPVWHDHWWRDDLRSKWIRFTLCIRFFLLSVNTCLLFCELLNSFTSLNAYLMMRMPLRTTWNKHFLWHV